MMTYDDRDGDDKDVDIDDDDTDDKDVDIDDDDKDDDGETDDDDTDVDIGDDNYEDKEKWRRWLSVGRYNIYIMTPWIFNQTDDDRHIKVAVITLSELSWSLSLSFTFLTCHLPHHCFAELSTMIRGAHNGTNFVVKDYKDVTEAVSIIKDYMDSLIKS